MDASSCSYRDVVTSDNPLVSLSLSPSLPFSPFLSHSLSVSEDEPPQTASGGVDELTPPVQIHSRASISEQDDQLPPLRPTRSLKSRSAGGAMGQRKMLVASYSDAADSAVSMVSWHVVVQYFSGIVIC